MGVVSFCIGAVVAFVLLITASVHLEGQRGTATAVVTSLRLLFGGVQGFIIAWPAVTCLNWRCFLKVECK